MIRYKKKLGEVIILLTLVLVISAIIFLPYIYNNLPFMGGYDVRNTYRLFYQEFRNLLSNSIYQKTLPFWSWNTFVGNNFWSSKTFYLIGDIYNYLFIFSKLHYYNILMYLTLIKFIISAIGFYLFGSYRGWKFNTVLIGSLLYTFAAWPFKYVEQPMFLSFYSLIPLYFLSIELTFKNKSKLFFVLMVFILTLVNYYLVYTVIIVSIIYYTYRFIEEHNTFKGLFIRIVGFIPFFILGIALASFLLLPTIIFMSESNRLFNTTFNWFKFNDIKVYLSLISNMFIPSSSYIGKAIQWNGNLEFSSFFETNTYQTREIMMWVGSITSILTIYGVFDPNKKLSKLNRFFYFLLFLIILLPIGDAFMHGLSEPSFRWLFFVVFMNLYVSMNYLDNAIFLNQDLLKKITTSICIILIGLLAYSIYITNESYLKYTRMIFIFLIFIALIFLSYYMFSQSKLRKYLILLVILEVSLNSYFSFFDNQIVNSFSWNHIRNSEVVLGKDYNQLKNYLKQFDDESEYYRIYAPYDSIYWYMSLNMNLVYNFSDVKTYDSTYQPALNDLFKIYPEIYISPQIWNITKPELIDFMSVKYAVVRESNELPHSNFILIGDYLGFQVYKNDNYRSVVQSTSEVISYDQVDIPFSSYNPNLVIAKTEDLELIKKYQNDNNIISLKYINLYQNMLTGTIESSDTTFLVSSIAYDKGWRVYINDIEMETYSVNGGFLGFPSLKGNQEVKLYFMPIGFKEGFIISGISLVILIVYFGYNAYKSNKNVTIIKGE